MIASGPFRDGHHFSMKTKSRRTTTRASAARRKTGSPRRPSPAPAAESMAPVRVVSGPEVYAFVRDIIPTAQRTLWIATADIKDMHVKSGARFVPFVKILAGLVEAGVEVRLMHAKEPGPRFRADFDRMPGLVGSPRFERVLCPRLHFKSVVVDGKIAYTGSANLTGAGMGAKNEHRRNFESGVITNDPDLVGAIMRQFDEVFAGMFCEACQRRAVCPDPIV
jgi:phosphatidylserine/phosphatidylglycerophosphate/cardiolipin synthase-like enzyme